VSDDPIEDGLDDLEFRVYRARAVGCSSPAEFAALSRAGWELTGEGCWRVRLAGGGELTLEPKLYGGHYLAVYDAGQELVVGKLEVKLQP
jgi:hypothetical protein